MPDKWLQNNQLQPSLISWCVYLQHIPISDHHLNWLEDHTQYVVIMSIIIAALMAFGIVRFVGMGTGNKGLYITGDV